MELYQDVQNFVNMNGDAKQQCYYGDNLALLYSEYQDEFLYIVDFSCIWFGY